MGPLSEEIAFLTRVATHANQRAAAVELAKLLDVWRDISVAVTVMGKVENGAGAIATQLKERFGERLSTHLIESADYDTVPADEWEDARKSAAIVCIVPAN